MNIEDTCINCGNKYVSAFDAFKLEVDMFIWFNTKEKVKPCCNNPRKATKNDIIYKIISEL